MADRGLVGTADTVGWPHDRRRQFAPDHAARTWRRRWSLDEWRRCQIP